MMEDLKTIASAAAGWWAVLCILFIVLFPFVGPALLWVLRTVLEALNSFGSGM